MAYIEEEIVKELNKIQAIKENIYPIIAPEGTQFPYLTYQISNDTPEQLLDGTWSNIRDFQITFDLITNKYDELKTYENQIAESLRALWGKQLGSFFIQQTTFRGPIELYEFEVGCFRASIEVSLVYEKEE